MAADWMRTLSTDILSVAVTGRHRLLRYRRAIDSLIFGRVAVVASIILSLRLLIVKKILRLPTLTVATPTCCSTATVLLRSFEIPIKRGGVLPSVLIPMNMNGVIISVAGRTSTGFF